MPDLPRDLPRLTSLRAFGALAVFGFHVGAQEPRWRPADMLFPHGYAGVAFFFVLSGFVLTWSSRGQESPGNFYRRRFARVWPLHAVTAGLALLLGAIATASAVIPNLLLVHAWSGQDRIVFGVNSPSWSLSCEAFFYACFPAVLILARRVRHRRFALLATGFFCLSAAGTLTAALAGPPWQNIVYANPAARLSEFILGIAVARGVQAGWRPRFGIPLAVLTTATLAAISHRTNPPLPLPDLVLLPGFCMIIAAAAVADVQARSGVLRHRALIYAGQVSFAFYLVHSLVIEQVGRRVDAPSFAVVVTALLLAAGAAVALHEAVERPAQRRLSPRSHRSAPASSSAGQL